MHVAHKDLKHRVNYFGGLPPEHHVFRFEDSHQRDTEPPFMQVNQLRLEPKFELFSEIVKKGEEFLPQNLLSTIPSLKSICKLKNFSNER